MSTSVLERKPLLTKERRIQQLNEDVHADPNFEHLRYRKRMVRGAGDLNSPVVLVLSHPSGLDEAEQRIMTGQQGKVLDAALAVADLKRSSVYITYVVKYPMPETKKEPRDPSKTEIDAALPYLVREINIIKPKVIVPLGRIPCDIFAPGSNPVLESGVIYEAKNRLVFPMWSPVGAIYSKTVRDELFESMRKLSTLI